MLEFIKACTGFLTPIFLVLSPVLSYGDQALSMHRKRTSAGFSLDIPLIMLVASFMRIAYWPGARFDTSLLIQAIVMVGVQVILLKVALDHRPPPSNKGGEASLPFAGAHDGLMNLQRPFNFWQWRSPKPYWQFVVGLLLTLMACEVLLSPLPQLYSAYSVTIGYVGLSVEAVLPLPQVLANMRSRSCKGFRLSVLASWLAGDAMKMFWFFTATTTIPWAFKMCNIFQAVCDSMLGVQFFLYSAAEKTAIKDHPLEYSDLAASHKMGIEEPVLLKPLHDAGLR